MSFSRAFGDLFNYVRCVDIDVYNIDTIGGIFRVDCNFRTLNNNYKDTVNNYVKPGEHKSFRCEVDIDRGVDAETTFTVEPPTKKVTEYKDVERERQVTAYRPVTKFRTETQCD